MNDEPWYRFCDGLRCWLKVNERVLPWKNHVDPYHIWVSEVFLQQTQAERVVDFYLRFTARFPTVESLAEATFEDALPYFRGLGFYGRLRRMLETARAIAQRKTKNVKRKNGILMRTRFPSTIEELEKLPGIGPYTARAIASFAFGQKCLAPDTNVVRVIGRYFGLGMQRMNEGTHGRRNEWVEGLVRKEVMSSLHVLDEMYPEDFSLNQALMDFGALVCLAKSPKCGVCPLKLRCVYKKKRMNVRTDGPVQFVQQAGLSEGRLHGGRRQRSLRKYQKVVCGVLIHDGKILVTRRRVDQAHAGLLEFPGGKVEKGEDERSALRREFLEELGVDISVRPAFEKVPVDRSKLLLSFHRCRILMGEPRPLEGQEVLWLRQADLDVKAFIPADKGVIESLKGSRL